MPCYDSRNTFNEGKRETEQKYSIVIKDLENKKRWLEAALCALLNELDRRGIDNSVVAEASRSGLIGLMEFWVNHKNSDKARIAEILHSYSKDEQAIMREILNEQVIE